MKTESLARAVHRRRPLTTLAIAEVARACLEQTEKARRPESKARRLKLPEGSCGPRAIRDKAQSATSTEMKCQQNCAAINAGALYAPPSWQLRRNRRLQTLGQLR